MSSWPSPPCSPYRSPYTALAARRVSLGTWWCHAPCTMHHAPYTIHHWSSLHPSLKAAQPGLFQVVFHNDAARPEVSTTQPQASHMGCSPVVPVALLGCHGDPALNCGPDCFQFQRHCNTHAFLQMSHSLVRFGLTIRCLSSRICQATSSSPGRSPMTQQGTRPQGALSQRRDCDLRRPGIRQEL